MYGVLSQSVIARGVHQCAAVKQDRRPFLPARPTAGRFACSGRSSSSSSSSRQHACRSNAVHVRRASAICLESLPQGQLRRQGSRTITAASGGQDASPQSDPTRTALSVGLGALWVGILGYVFMFSPNQTPIRDQIFLERLVGLGSEGIEINTVFFALFNLMGVYPVLYAAVLNPSAKSSNKVPLSPFLALSFATGVFSLLPYFALWAPLPADQQELPPKSELGFVRKALESKITAGLLLGAATGLLVTAATAGSEAWTQFLYLFDESRFVHVTSLDFLLLTAFMPFWLSNDASFRKWAYQDSAAFLGFIPLIGPAIYLLLRPRSK